MYKATFIYEISNKNADALAVQLAFILLNCCLNYFSFFELEEELQLPEVYLEHFLVWREAGREIHSQDESTPFLFSCEAVMEYTVYFNRGETWVKQGGRSPKFIWAPCALGCSDFDFFSHFEV